MAYRALLAAFLLLSAPAMADSQSSNSSSNCSNGICTRSDSLVIEGDGRRQGWVRQEVWDERARHGWIERNRRHVPRGWRLRDRDDDDDDDDDD
jgi:hypothetical protein